MTKTNYSLPADLQKDIRSVITAELNLPEAATLQYKIIYDDDRRIYKIKVAESSEFFVLKIRGIKVVKQQDHDLDDLQKEYQLLENAWASAKSMPSNFGMSKPIKLWLEEKAMLLSGCKGVNFNDWFNQHIIKWSLRPFELQNAIKNVGEWLGSYHQNAATTVSLDQKFDNRTSHLKRMLGYLTTNSRHRLSEDKINQIEAQFEQLVKQSSTGSVAQVHGNFAYRNILYSSDQINLVDFEDAHQEHVAFDIGQFLAEIMFKSQFPWLRHLTNRLTSSFLTGYQQQFEQQKNLTEAYLGYHLVVHLYEHCSRKKPNGLAGLILSYRIRYLTGLIKNWISQNQP